MDEKLLAFISAYLGAANAGNTPGNRGQCVGLVMLWLVANGQSIMYQNAVDILAAADPKVYKVVENTPTNFPPPGAVVCWDASWGGGYGHTAVVVAANEMHMAVFEQNNPEGYPPRVSTQSYNGVKGWLLLPGMAQVGPA